MVKKLVISLLTKPIMHESAPDFESRHKNTAYISLSENFSKISRNSFKEYSIFIIFQIFQAKLAQIIIIIKNSIFLSLNIVLKSVRVK